MKYRIGIDVGGTFTDLVLAAGGRIRLEKHPTTPEDQSEGVLAGLTRLAHGEGLATEALLARTALVVHGTTTADNTMIEMSGATVGLVTSEGHRDEIEIRRGYKEDIWDPALPPPPPICPRRRRYGVPERLDFEGRVVVPLDEQAVRRALRRMGLQGVDSLAVVFLFSFVDPAHERRVREIAAEELPGVMVSLSHEVVPSAPEFERTSTTLVNAYVGPRIERYLGALERRLRSAGFAGELLIMQSNGGVMPGGYVAQKAVAVMGSGPAGGVHGAGAVRGGVEPTVTDANLVLGYLSPERFSDGQMRLDVERAHAALRDRVAAPLGLSVLEAAEGIFRLVNANMANAVRKVSAGRGIDPRPLVLVAFGGNGPVHAGMQARELGIRRIFVPKLAPAFSALGLLLSDHVADEMRSYVTPVGRVDLVRANALLAEMEAAARRALGRPARFERLAALCYPGQTFDMPVPLVARNGALTPRGLADTVARFHRMHEELHTYACRDEEPILRALRIKAVATDEKPALPRAERGPAAKARAGARKAFFGGRLVPTPVYDGTKLGPGATIDGPALVDEPFTTVVVYPGQQARVDRFGNYAISVGRA